MPDLAESSSPFSHDDRLWFDHNCHPRYAEPCEGCGLRVRYMLGRDWQRDWFDLEVAIGHSGSDCEDCESWWARHTPLRCRQARARMRKAATADA